MGELGFTADGRTSSVEGSTESTLGPVGYALRFLASIVLTYVTIFFNAALVHAANERMSGGDPTLGSPCEALPQGVS